MPMVLARGCYSFVVGTETCVDYSISVDCGASFTLQSSMLSLIKVNHNTICSLSCFYSIYILYIQVFYFMYLYSYIFFYCKKPHKFKV